MKINITMFKSSGKFYADQTAESKESFKMYEDDFLKFIYDNLPASLSNGYVVVSNADPDSQEFFEGLYITNELKSKVEHMRYIESLDYTQLSIDDL